MKYIRRDGTGWDHGPYWSYIDAAKIQMPPHIGEFASNEENHDLKNPNSLHDAWLESWNIVELPAAAGSKKRVVRVEAKFLGPRHDRYIFLTYSGVSRYEMECNEQTDNPYPHSHGDVLAHELIMLSQDKFSHEIVFSTGAQFYIHFSNLDHMVEVFKSSI